MARGESLFTAAVLATVAWALWESREWGVKAGLFPWVIGFPLLALLAAQLVATLRARPAAASAGRDASAEVGASMDPRVHRRRAAAIVGWLVGFALAIWLLGFPIGGTLGTLAYLRLAARERWPISLAITAGTAAFFWVLINLLNVPFPPGALIAPFVGG